MIEIKTVNNHSSPLHFGSRHLKFWKMLTVLTPAVMGAAQHCCHGSLPSEKVELSYEKSHCQPALISREYTWSWIAICEFTVSARPLKIITYIFQKSNMFLWKITCRRMLGRWNGVKTRLRTVWLLPTYQLLQIYRRIVKSLNLWHKKEATRILQY